MKIRCHQNNHNQDDNGPVIRIIGILLSICFFLIILIVLRKSVIRFEEYDNRNKTVKAVAHATKDPERQYVIFPETRGKELSAFFVRMQNIIEAYRLSIWPSEVDYNAYLEDWNVFYFDSENKDNAIACKEENGHVLLQTDMDSMEYTECIETMATLIAANEDISYSEAKKYAEEIYACPASSGKRGCSKIIQLQKARYFWSFMDFEDRFYISYPDNEDIPETELEEYRQKGLAGLNTITGVGECVDFTGRIEEVLNGAEHIVVNCDGKRILAKFDFSQYPGVFKEGDEYEFVAKVNNPVESHDGYVEIVKALSEDMTDAYTLAFDSNEGEAVCDSETSEGLSINYITEREFTLDMIRSFPEPDDWWDYVGNDTGSYAVMTVKLIRGYKERGGKEQKYIEENATSDKYLKFKDYVWRGKFVNTKNDIDSFDVFDYCFADYCTVDPSSLKDYKYVKVYGRMIPTGKDYVHYFYVMYAEPSDYQSPLSNTKGRSGNYSIHDGGEYNVTDYDDPSVFADDWWGEFSDSDDEEEGWGLAYDYWEEYN